MTEFSGLRPVITQPEHDFGKLIGKVLSPSRPLQSEEFLRGREEQLSSIRQALYQAGRHVLIHGLRGVGKSSLAQTAAFSLPGERDPIVLGCDDNTSFKNLVREIFEESASRKPQIESVVKERGLSVSRFGIGLSVGEREQEGKLSDPSSVNEAVRIVKFICDQIGELVIVVDEFDQVSDVQEQRLFTNFIKQISDRHVPVKFIFFGIGESVEAIMAAHASADRYFHTVNLSQLPWEARFEIVNDAASRLGIEKDRSTTIRIARISDGFPHYVHSISEKLFWRVFYASNGGKVTVDLFEGAMSDAAQSMDMKLKGPYEIATQKYRDDYETILWAAADGHELKRRSTDIFNSYKRIMSGLGLNPLPRDRFNRRLNALKTQSHAQIVSGTRQGWYEFTEKMIRGYVRLRAEQRGVELEVDHPAGRRRIGTLRVDS